MPTKAYREIQVNMKSREGAREALQTACRAKQGPYMPLMRDNLAVSSSTNEQLVFIRDKCAPAAEQLHGLSSPIGATHNDMC